MDAWKLPGLRALANAWQTLRYASMDRPWPMEFPVVVQFPINDICDSKCQMCNIWQRKIDQQVTVAETGRIFADPLFKRVEAVGLNGGEPTLRPDLPDLGEAIAKAAPRLKQISLITNALNADRAIERIDALAARLAVRGITLDVMVSLDGVDRTHDLVRGVTGNFASAVRVLDHLLRRKDINVRVGCTIVQANVHGLHELLDFCRARDVYVKFRLGVPHKRLYNIDPAPGWTIGKRSWLNTHPFELDPSERWHVSQFLLALAKDYEPSLQQRLFYRSLAGQVLHGAPRRAGCDWQHRGATITSRGELMYCAVQSDVLGDARGGDAERLYFGNREHLERIVRDKCADCAHDYVGRPGGRQELQLFVERVRNGVGLTRDRARSLPGYGVALRFRRFLDARALARQRREFRSAPADRTATGGHSPSPILVCGWYGTETLGDKAILATIVAAIRAEAPGHPIVIASLEPHLTRLTIAEMPELEGCETIEAGAALPLVASSRALVFAGGPLMAVREMGLMEALFLRAKSHGVPGIVAGCGVGPLGAGEYRDTIASLLRTSSVRIYRDEESRRTAARLGVGVDGDQVTEDPAFAWVDAARAIAPDRDAATPTLALGLRDWPYAQYAPQLGAERAEQIRRNVRSTVATALERLIDTMPGVRILPIPFCTHAAGDDDRLVYWELVRHSAKLRSAIDTSTISRDLGPGAYLQAMKSAHACLAMRFHSLVFSLGLGLPTVALDYTLGAGKTHSLGKRFGIDTLRVDEIEADQLASRLRQALLSTRTGVAGNNLHFPATFRAALRAALLLDGAMPESAGPGAAAR